MLKQVCLGLVLLLPVAMMGQSSKKESAKETNPSAQKTKVSQKASEQKQESSQLSEDDKTFLKALVEEDLSEISLAQMALKKTSDPRVKDYAQTKILAADPGMKDGAAKILKEHGVTPPSKPNQEQQAEYTRLQKKTGKYFDTAYMNYETSMQADDYELVERILKSTSNAEVKSYVETQEKPVREAAMAAKQISEQIAVEMQSYQRPAVETKSK